MSTEERKELKLCPFCGSEPVLQTTFDQSFMVCCDNPNCQAQGRLSGKEEKAINAWNTRASQSEWVSVLEGYKLVPIKPTIQMKSNAAFNLCNEFDHGEVEVNEALILAAYRELVNAAPEPPKE